MTDDAPGGPNTPRHWEADVLLRDGRTAHLRPIRPEDAELFVEFYSRVSDQSKYYRFFSPMPTLSERDVTRFTQVDHRRRVALVMLLQGRMIAVGRYEADPDDDSDRAEVAFLVEDLHHGRGIGQILLEHLAQAARERGIGRFVAEVLPDNVKMIHTFRDAGYRLVSGYQDGVIELEFPIDPTETAVGVMRGREHRAEAASIQRFLNPRSVAIVGASRRQDTIGRVLVRNLVNGNYTGRIYVVNPSADAVSGMPAYQRVQDVPDEVDVAIVAVPAESVSEVVLDCAAKGVHGMIVISSGFAETGEEGRRRQRHLVGLSRSYGLRLIGPNCLGVINTDPAVSINASLSHVLPPRGRAGFFCQSGALGSAILEKVESRGLGLSTFISAGNRADVSGNDLLQYWEEDDSTEVVLLYLESIGNPRKFSRIARRVSLRKPIIAVRSGRTTQGVPMGHAVRRIAAPGAAVDAMFRQAGVIQVDTLEEMFDVAQLLAHQSLPAGSTGRGGGELRRSGPAGRRCGRVGGAGGEPLGGPGRRRRSAEDFEDALDTAIDDPEVDSVIAVYIPPLNVSGEDVANVLAAVGEQSDKPLVSSFLGAEGVPELLRVPDVAGSTAGRGSVPSYPAVEAAVRALARVVDYAVWLRTPDGAPLDPAEVDTARGLTLVSPLAAANPEGLDLDHDQLTELLATYGIEFVADPAGELPACGPGRRAEAGVGRRTQGHRRASARASRLAHVWRNIDSRAEMRAAWESLGILIEDGGQNQFVVQKNAPPGVPIAIRSIEDPLFGPVISFGISGPIIDLLEDRSYRIPPLGERDVASMIREVKSSPMLFGYRGAELVDIEEVERLVSRVAQLQNDLPQVSSLELSLVLAGAHGASVLTAAARVAPVSEPRADLFTRRLPDQPGDTIPD